MAAPVFFSRAHSYVGRLVGTSAKAAGGYRGRGPKRGGALRPRRWQSLARRVEEVPQEARAHAGRAWRTEPPLYSTTGAVALKGPD